MLNQPKVCSDIHTKIIGWRKFYITYLLLGAVMSLNFYLDYSCGSHLVMPTDYLSSNSQFEVRRLFENDDYQCQSNKDCNHGKCSQDYNLNGTVIGTQCVCSTDYITTRNEYCNYHQLSGLALLLISIFVGGCGIDRCVLARGDSCAICLGVLKGITFGGVGIWYVVDVILIGTSGLNDGNGYPLSRIR